jgi:predicted RNA-binding Zn-ribbon protein involved in translation (DUF1610 family)
MEVKCNECGHSLTVKRDFVSFFCPKCHTRIESKSLPRNKKGLRGLFGRPVAAPVTVPTVVIKCTHCESDNDVPKDAVSAFCKKCKKRIELKPPDKVPRADFSQESKAQGTTKMVKCFHCNGMQKVSTEAYSATCTGCGKRIHVKDMEIKDYQVQDVISGGKVFVRKGSVVQANIKAADIEVSGEVIGNIYAENNLVLRSGAKIVGVVTAKNFVMLEGAMLKGSVNAKAIKTHSKGKNSKLSATG